MAVLMAMSGVHGLVLSCILNVKQTIDISVPFVLTVVSARDIHYITRDVGVCGRQAVVDKANVSKTRVDRADLCHR